VSTANPSDVGVALMPARSLPIWKRCGLHASFAFVIALSPDGATALSGLVSDGVMTCEPPAAAGRNQCEEHE